MSTISSESSTLINVKFSRPRQTGMKEMKHPWVPLHYTTLGPSIGSHGSFSVFAPHASFAIRTYASS